MAFIKYVLTLSKCFRINSLTFPIFVLTVQLLARTIQGTYISEGGGFDYDQSWLCAM
jgi:hypothetical protein